MDTTSLLPPVTEALAEFPKAFHDETEYVGSLGVAWAPGRVNLIGEHTDYNGGLVLPLAVDRVSAFAGRTRADQTVRLWSIHFKTYAQFSVEGLPDTFDEQRAELPGWARYILGVAAELARAGITLKGFDAVVSGDVPLGGGMSSSAALEVAAAHAYALFSNHAFTIGEENATLSPILVAGLCQHAEQIASGVMCGILDQAASCLGQPRKAVLLNCRSLEYRYLPFADPTISIVVVDTGVRRELADSAYNERRQQCEEATKLIRESILQAEPANELAHDIKELCDITPEQFARYKQQLPELLQRRAGYVIAENERVLQVVKLLEAGNIEEAGKILWLGHAGLQNDYEVSCTELDALVDIACNVPGVLGARMMGGGFGGCTINLVRHEAVEALQQAIELQYPERTGRRASIDICRAAAGPGCTFVA
ncbi:galactokinase [Dictyobacter arantiisoli]|uniref:Galactokinase n=1 Tax=Dictyobacter arantiisoli TaxID=2014874 RepID=A0A5A5TGD0_9CHLR|nr:galactokinase [Dictyobacter arantiisoli]GCF10402.1 galactokinase [Dictyobacter arantiisoli]